MFYRVYPRELCSRGARVRGSLPGFYRLLFSNLALAKKPLEEQEGNGALWQHGVAIWRLSLCMIGAGCRRREVVAQHRLAGVVDESGLAGEVHHRLFAQPEGCLLLSNTPRRSAASSASS